MMLEFPLRTCSTNHGNGREHWAARSRRVKAERTTVRLVLRSRTWGDDGWWWMALALKERRGRGAAHLPLTVTLTRVSPRELDDDNLRGALKGVRDQVAEELGVDDRDPCVEWAYAQAKGKPKSYAVRIQIEGKR